MILSIIIIVNRSRQETGQVPGFLNREVATSHTVGMVEATFYCFSHRLCMTTSEPQDHSEKAPGFESPIYMYNQSQPLDPLGNIDTDMCFISFLSVGNSCTKVVAGI